MKKILNSILILAVIVMASCTKSEELPDTTLVSPINGLILTVQGTDYIAVPKVVSPGKLSDTLEIKVAIPDVSATIKQITLAEAGATTTLSNGSLLQFVDDVAEVEVKSASSTHKYFVKMNYTPPPFMYFIKTSDKNADGVKYFLNASTAQKIASGSYNDKFEGYIDLTATNWDNIGLVNSNLAEWYDVDGGWWPEQSSGSFTLKSNTNTSDGVYSCMGPWADWNWFNSNTAIISPGYWKLNYDATTMKLDLLETQWAIKGAATSNNTTALTYNPETKLWTINDVSLSAGTLRFVTIPVTAGDPVVGYGDASTTIPSGKLITTGSDISITVAGSYKIVLKLSTPPNYSYTLTKN